MSASSQPPSPLDLTITRTFKAPRQLVYDAWTMPEHLAHWSGPEGFTTPHAEQDVRPGGKYRACLRSPGGEDHWVIGEYRELTPPSRIVMTHGWEDADGNPGPSTLITITFEDAGAGATLMTFHQGPFESAASRDGHHDGWSTSFDKLASWLAAAVKV